MGKQCTSRIVLVGEIIYVESSVVSELKRDARIMQLNQKYFPLAGERFEVECFLANIARKQPHRMSNTSIEYFRRTHGGFDT